MLVPCLVDGYSLVGVLVKVVGGGRADDLRRRNLGAIQRGNPGRKLHCARGEHSARGVRAWETKIILVRVEIMCHLVAHYFLPPRGSPVSP